MISSSMKWAAYIRTVFIIALLRAADLVITFVYTPDLASEWNPLVSLFGLTWYGFVITQVCLIIFISGMMFFYFNRTPPEITLDGLSLSDFSYMYFFGKLRPWPQRLFTIPRNITPHLVLNGFVFMVIAIGISIFAIINNLLLISENALYITFVENYHKTYFLLTFALMVVTAPYLFLTKEYNQYKKRCKNQKL